MILISCSGDKKETLSKIDEPHLTEQMVDSVAFNTFIIETDSVNHTWNPIQESDSRQKIANINPTFISIDSLGVGQDVIFNVYEEESLVGNITRVSKDLNDVKSISGHILEDKGSFVFTVNEGRLLGQLRLTDRDKIIQIGFNEHLNAYMLTELNRKNLDVLPGSAPMRRSNN